MRRPKVHQKPRVHKADHTSTSTDSERLDRGHTVVLTSDDLDLKSKKRKKRSSSKTTRRVEDIERYFSKAAHRVTKAVNHGVSTYEDDRDASARTRRDGALVDLYENVVRGASVAISEASPATVDVAKAFNTKMARRQIRRALNSLPRLPFL